MAHKWVPEMDALLGRWTDTEVADRLGVPRRTICQRRNELGISAFKFIAWTPEMDALLGVVSTREVSKRLGISKSAARKRRRKLGISSLSEQDRVLPEGMESWTLEAKRIYETHRRHRKKGLLDTLTYEQWKYACEWFGNKCAYCGADEFLTEDHLVPLSKDGPRTALNILPACWFCNNSKLAQRAHIWIYRRFGIEEGKKVAERIVEYLTEVSS